MSSIVLLELFLKDNISKIWFGLKMIFENKDKINNNLIGKKIIFDWVSKMCNIMQHLSIRKYSKTLKIIIKDVNLSIFSHIYCITFLNKFEGVLFFLPNKFGLQTKLVK